MKIDIISRMEAMQQRFGNEPTFAEQEFEQDDPDRVPTESERQILRCAPPFDAQAEHEADLRYESRVDYESWQYDGPEEKL